MSSYNISARSVTVLDLVATLFTVGFGDPAGNDVIVQDAVKALDTLPEVRGDNPGGLLALVNGPASLPVAAVISHSLDHRFGAVGFFDPKLGGYVVSITHSPAFQVGQVIPKDAVS